MVKTCEDCKGTGKCRSCSGLGWHGGMPGVWLRPVGFFPCGGDGDELYGNGNCNKCAGKGEVTAE